MSTEDTDNALVGISDAYNDIAGDFETASAFYDMGCTLVTGSDSYRLSGTTLTLLFTKENNQ